MIISVRLVICTVGLMAFAACSGGSGPVQKTIVSEQNQNNVPDDPAPSQQAPSGNSGEEPPLDDFGTEPPVEVEIEASTLLETLAAAGETDTILRGLIVSVDPVTGDRTITLREGLYSFETETLTLDGKGVALSEDIPGAFLVSSGVVQSNGSGIIGIATADVDIPLMGDATYAGGAAGFVITPAAGFDLTNGDSLVTVAFESGTVTAELSNFTDVSQVSGNELSAPISQIIWRDAEISGSSFAGGRLETLNGLGEAVDITGTNTNVSAQGQFFGLDDESLNPAEVGGLIYSKGDGGIVFGSFIAD